MSREISWVRPPMRPFTDSRSERVWVADGSMAYSAVTQPSPESLRQRGTPRVAEAAQSTLVRPNSTSTEPAGWSSQLRVILMGRSSSFSRPSGRVVMCETLPRADMRRGTPPPAPVGGRLDRSHPAVPRPAPVVRRGPLVPLTGATGGAFLGRMGGMHHTGDSSSPPPGHIPAPRSPHRYTSSEADELSRLRQGNQATFAELVRRLHPTMVRVASGYVSSRAVAEEVAQDTWVAVIEQLDRFEGRSSLKTWILRILTNKAKTRGAQERRTTPFSALASAREAEEPVLSPDAFFDESHRWSGHWTQ